MKPTFRVALLIETSNRYGRDLLFGVHDQAQQDGHWAVTATEQGRRAPLPAWLRGWRGDGIIARVDSPAIAAALRRTGLPVVDVSAERAASEFPRVSIDNAAVARLAAEHLLGKSFRQLAYCGDRRFRWSRERGRHFRQLAAAAGRSCAVFPEPVAGGPSAGTDAELARLAAWLEHLPKPVGVFACFDGRARQVLEACQLSGRAVPDEVAVLGVDNDEVLCELSSPPLSSVLPNARRTGQEAAAILGRMMRGGRALACTLEVAPLRVVGRQSTDAVCVADRQVAAAVRFIGAHACEGIGVAAVLRAVPGSRTCLERKFRHWLGRTPHQLIAQCRLERARQLLAETELAIAEVAELAGFDSGSYLSVAFRRAMGATPLAYRRQHRPVGAGRGGWADRG